MYIHPLTYLFIVLIVVTGMFKEFAIIFSIIIIHELGHFSVSKVFNWNLDKISIYPFGGCVKFNEKLNRPLYEELFILLGGPCLQIIYFLFIYFLYDKGIFSYRNYILFKEYNYALLWFNLLPIYPLDGGRILNVVNNYIFSFKISNKITIIFSYIFILYILIKLRNINLNSMVILLGYEDFVYLKRQSFLYNKLLLERFIGDFKFKKFKVIRSKDSFYKDRRHIIKSDNRYITEKEYLYERFGD